MRCVNCLNPIVPKQRYTKLALKTCLNCGDHKAKQRRHTIAPINKSNYMLITDLELLKQLNPKRTT
jgi:recombinational DNA repair protein (RecF pathway)